MKDFAFNICLLGTVAALLASSHVTAGFLDLTADRFAPALSSGEATAEFRTSLPPVSSFSSSLATIQPVRQRSTSKNYESRATESGSFVTNTRDLAATRVTSAPLLILARRQPACSLAVEPSPSPLLARDRSHFSRSRDALRSFDAADGFDLPASDPRF